MAGSDPRDPRLIEALRDVPREQEPARDLWPDVARRIAARRSRMWIFRGAGASLGLALAASAVLYATRPRPAPHDASIVPPAPVSALASAASPPAPEAEPSLVPGEAEYRDAARLLLADYQRQRSAISPATVRILDENLSLVDAAIDACRSALRTDPNDADLRASLDLAYEQKLELLRAAAELPAGT
jgi:hypothetical protein